MNRGQEVRATLIEEVIEPEKRRKNSRYTVSRWKLQSPDLPDGWSCLLRSITGKLYQVGDADTFWIWEIDERNRNVLVSDSNFGRMPISDRMRPRYVRGLRALVTVVSPQNPLTDIQPADLSEASGLFERCVRRNQWDWFTVWSVLNFPDTKVLRDLRNMVKTLRVSLVAGNAEASSAARHKISQWASADSLQVALDVLRASVPPLPQASIGDVSGDTPVIEHSETIQLAAETQQRLERANSEHLKTQDLLEYALETKGYNVEHSRFVDVYARLKSGPAIFEVKSITTGNERSQCRHALSQLYEYRYLHQVPDASLWLVFSQAPTNDWIVSYLVEDRGINVLWRDGDLLAGPSLGHLDAATLPNVGEQKV